MQRKLKPNRNLIKLKYKIAWYVGTMLSFILYFSGILPLYFYFRREYLKHHIAIVLMYHRINDYSDATDKTVSTKKFEQQISYLKKRFKIISLDEMVNLYKQNIQLREDTAAITFDDGYKDNFTDAYPILRKYNIPAAIFVAADYIGKDYGLSKEEMLMMQKNNITFGAHTINHRVLSELDRALASFEIKDSKLILEEILNEKVKYFAYPYGKRNRDFSDESMEIVKEAGYDAAFSTDNGFVDSKSNCFALNRIGIRNFPLFVIKCRLSGIFENKFVNMVRSLAGL